MEQLLIRNLPAGRAHLAACWPSAGPHFAAEAIGPLVLAVRS